jgi:CRP-like cAMP-binding protein
VNDAPGRFLDEIGEPAAAALLEGAVIRRWPPRSVLFHEGDRADRVLFVQEGRVKLVATESNGNETLLAVRGPGDLIGELAAIDGHPRSATAIALAPVVCSAVAAEQFAAVLSTEPVASMALLRVLATRLREAERRRAEHGALDAAQRLARRLDELAGARPTIDGLNQNDLAALIGASRESVAKALQILRAEGLVRTGRLSIEILDGPGRRRRASGR